MPRFATSVNFSSEFHPIWEELKKKAKKEGKSFQKFLEEDILLPYAKKHLRDNPSFTLYPWMKKSDFKALPTIGEDPFDYLSDVSEEDLILLAKKIKSWKTAIHPLIRELDYKWDW